MSSEAAPTPAWPSSALLDPETLTRIGNLELVARRVVEGFLTGLHRSVLRGFSTEFDQFRPYTQGDDLKHVDWKLFARTDRFFVKEYEADRNLDTLLLVDGSGSMAYPENDPSKSRYAGMLAASLAYLLLRQRDRVGLARLGEESPRILPPQCRPGQLQRITSNLAAAQPGGGAHLGKAVEAVVRRARRRGLVVLISDLYMEPEALNQGLALLRRAGHEVLVFHLVHRDEIEFPFRGTVEFVDLETGESVAVDATAAREAYLHRMNQFLESSAEACASCGAAYLRLDTTAPLAGPLAAFLSARAGRSGAGVAWR